MIIRENDAELRAVAENGNEEKGEGDPYDLGPFERRAALGAGYGRDGCCLSGCYWMLSEALLIGAVARRK